MKKIIAALMSLTIALSCAITPITVYGEKSYSSYGVTSFDESTQVKVKINYDELYGEAFKVLDIVNKERAANGRSPLKMDKGLLDTAMYRAAETSLYFDHIRPNGDICYAANRKMRGENIAAGQTDAENVMTSWMNSSGHKANILGSSYTSVGIGCVQVNGTKYWVQCFGATAADTEVQASSYSSKVSESAEIVDLVKNISLIISGNTDIKQGESTQLEVWTRNPGFTWVGTYFDPSCLTFTSSNPSVLTVAADGTITGVSGGKATVTVYVGSNTSTAVSVDVTVTGTPTKDDSSSSSSSDSSTSGGNSSSGSSSDSSSSSNPNSGNNSNSGSNNGGSTTVTKKSLSKGKITCGSKYAFTGKGIKPSVTVKVGSTKLIKNKDYTVKYSNNKKVGTATITVTGKGNYTGKLTKTFKINPAKQKIQKLTAKKKAFYIDYVQKDSATGYEIQYATNSKFSKAKTVKVTKKKTDKKTISKLSGKKKYWVRVRSYTIVKGKKYTGAWSPVKTVTTKK